MVTVAVQSPLTVAEAAERRRSVREYRSQPVPHADLEAILRIAGLAPSAFNLQPWRWVIVESDPLKSAVAAAAFHQRQLQSAPAVIVLYTDTADAVATREEVVHPAHDADRRTRALGAIERAFLDKTDEARESWGEAQGYIALGYLLLAATSFGYQTVPMLGFHAESVKAVLGLPSHVRVPALIAIGHGAEDGLTHHRHSIERVARFHRGD